MINDPLPNIIIILVDDLGEEWVSCYGAEDINRPILTDWHRAV